MGKDCFEKGEDCFDEGEDCFHEEKLVAAHMKHMGELMQDTNLTIETWNAALEEEKRLKRQYNVCVREARKAPQSS